MSPKKANKAIDPLSFPAPPKVRWRTAVRSHFVGRKDARKKVLTATFQTPFSRQLEARTSIGYSSVGDQLHRLVLEVDQSLAGIASTVIELERRKVGIESQQKETEDNLAGAEGVDAVTLRRQLKRIASEKTALDAEILGAQQQAGFQAAKRRHLIDRAREAKRAWDGNFSHVGNIYLRGFDLKDKSHSFTQLNEPVANQAWIDGDLPFMVTVVDPQAQQVIKTMLQEFYPKNYAVANAGIDDGKAP